MAAAAVVAAAAAAAAEVAAAAAEIGTDWLRKPIVDGRREEEVLRVVGGGRGEGGREGGGHILAPLNTRRHKGEGKYNLRERRGQTRGTGFKNTGMLMRTAARWRKGAFHGRKMRKKERPFKAFTFITDRCPLGTSIETR